MIGGGGFFSAALKPYLLVVSRERESRVDGYP